MNTLVCGQTQIQVPRLYSIKKRGLSRILRSFMLWQFTFINCKTSEWSLSLVENYSAYEMVIERVGYTRESSRPTTNLHVMFLSVLEGTEQLTTCAYYDRYNTTDITNHRCDGTDNFLVICYTSLLLCRAV